MNREKAEAEHRKRIRAYEREIKRIYTSLVDEAAKIGTSVKNFDKSKPFRFDDYPQTRKRIEKLFDDYRTEVLATISGGIDNEFTKQNEFFLSVLRGYFQVPDNYYSPVNKKAVEAFIERKNNGMNLSQRVWKYSGQLKEELEMSIDLGLREGRSAQQMSRDIRKYLNNPYKLFRRVRDEHGNLQLSKNAKAFHPGAGVYRSSYKNAVRLTGTETNIAYRTADYDSIQTEDFVLGIRIELSNNHTTNGKPLTDICDELKGVYPKDFKFTGWHPNCRCKVITINASMDDVIDHIKNGTPYKGYITDTPPNFKKWVAENQEKLQTTNSLPYFVRDNEKYFPQMKITPKAMAGVLEERKFNAEMEQINHFSTSEKRYNLIELKRFSNGGKLSMIDTVKSNATDYKDIYTIGRRFAEQGKTVQILDKIHYKNNDYDKFFGSLKNSVYYKKCPDLNINGKYYEYEGFSGKWNKKKIGRMISHGAKQSSNIIIKNTKGCTDRFIIKSIHDRLRDKKFKYEINEVWVYEKGEIRMVYKKQ